MSKEQWNIGQPGGPAGPFYSIVSSTGMVIALQIPDQETAERICRLPELEERIAELEMKQIPLEQQFEDWAKQNAKFQMALAQLQNKITELKGFLKEINK